ncbi:MAG: histidine phosphatase family protein [Pseudomonadota bacterium]
MDLILWRHAEAEDGVPDLARTLTPKGLKQAARMGDLLRPLLPQGTRILVSPAKRTQQTAQALTPEFSTEPAIAPGAAPQAVLSAAGWPHGTGCVMLVGHQPSLGIAAALIMTGREHGWKITKSGVWWFSRDPADAQVSLRLVISADQL